MRVSLNTSLDVGTVDQIGKIAKAQRRRVSQIVEEALNFWLENAHGARTKVRGDDEDRREQK